MYSIKYLKVTLCDPLFYCSGFGGEKVVIRPNGCFLYINLGGVAGVLSGRQCSSVDLVI